MTDATQPLAVLTRTPGTPALRRSPADPVPVAPTLPNPKRWAVREQREAAKLERREAARHERETLRLQRIEEKRLERETAKQEREDANRQARDEESAMRRRIALAEDQQATRLAAITYVPGTIRAKLRMRREAAGRSEDR